MKVKSMRCCALAALALVGLPAVASAQDMQAGSVTKLPVPRYVSLKTDRVNLREGPSKEHRTRWVYQRAGLPVEITAEFETWRRVRDADGTEGWVLHSLLSGRRTALVAPWSKKKDEAFPMLSAAAEEARVVARLQPGVVANVASCADAWCRISVGNLSGYIRQERLWGVYPNEKVD
ncbi:SH3 domain-containing protein [Bosea sp. (in: a-proteobacteria)]|uniref:SH3 domain-containing protein n=1 Tax=Bosea sp. (in: a-proteobacteria) TaxID=1871050 RepID=UPI00261C168D|nr:SH3 domain-containing protein [Bosea sp. (in: a-proteobacteria)]MCO5091362.1 SH3 domain-containing protein [Bosea sp. (in: a-proteobacteria)]